MTEYTLKKKSNGAHGFSRCVPCKRVFDGGRRNADWSSQRPAEADVARCGSVSITLKLNSIQLNTLLLLACCAFVLGKWETGIFFTSYMLCPDSAISFFCYIQLLYIYDSVVFVYLKKMQLRIKMKVMQ